MPSLTLQHIAKTYGTIHALRDVNLDVAAGELVSILGPSGCGKTTLLRIIAGFEQPTSGTISFDGLDVTHLPPRERKVGMVFQNYALFPHMTVFENVAFGLETKRPPQRDIRRRVMEMLEMVHLADKTDTPVPQLSGGEQQRVAVARALVVEPNILLFDEPLSNLDVSLRVRTREEIRLLQQRFTITAIYVTHDQEEAMSMSDRIAVMRDGRFEQVGTPAEVYQEPQSVFVAEFLGGANILTGRVENDGNTLLVGNMRIALPSPAQAGSTLTVAVKPEAVTITPTADDGDYVGVVRQREYLGFITMFILESFGTTLRTTAISSSVADRINYGDTVGFRFDWSCCRILRSE